MHQFVPCLRAGISVARACLWPTPLSWGLLRSREGAFKGQPDDEQAGVGTLFQRGLVLGVWQEELASDCFFCVCADVCRPVLLGLENPAWVERTTVGLRWDKGLHLTILACLYIFAVSFFYSPKD
jgi:hypothetical protein